MRKYLVTGLLALGAASGAQAAVTPTITFTPGVFSLNPALSTATVFEAFEGGGAPNTQYNPATQADPRVAQRGFSESVSGDVPIFQGIVPNEAVNPDLDGDRFLAIQNGSFTVNLGSGVSFFSFVFGSLDNYNVLRLNFADGDFREFTGTQIIGQTGVGPRNSGVAGRVSFDTGTNSQITSAVFSSSVAAFEIDNIAAAVPEPATWAMMIFGFGLVGSTLRNRKSRTKVSFA